MVFEKFKLTSFDTPIQAIEYSLSKEDIDARTIYQFRKNLGVNLGGLFVLEENLFPDWFPQGFSLEKLAVKELISIHGVKRSRSLLENHWRNYMGEEDWMWLQQHNITLIRVPIGYWIVKGGSFCSGTDFDEISSVYKNAWSIFKMYYIAAAQKYNISVLVDYHVYPGTEEYVNDHFRDVNTKYLKFTDSMAHQLQVLNSMKFLGEDLISYSNVLAIQISNNFDSSSNVTEIQRFYQRCIATLRRKNLDLAVVISDGYSCPQWCQWVSELEKEGILNLAVESHFYSFGSAAADKTPFEVAKDLTNTVLPHNNQFEVDVMIGEFSCEMLDATWKNGNDAENKDAQTDYGLLQAMAFNNKARLGSYFWSFKFGNIDPSSLNSCGADFRTMVTRGILLKPETQGKKIPALSDYNQRLRFCLAKHCQGACKKKPMVKYINADMTFLEFEFESFAKQEFVCVNYSAGFETGWNDAKSFFQFHGSAIGKVFTLKNIRKQQWSLEFGDERLIDWEHGYLNGVQEFEKLVF